MEKVRTLMVDYKALIFGHGGRVRRWAFTWESQWAWIPWNNWKTRWKFLLLTYFGCSRARQYIHLPRLQLMTGYNSCMATTPASPSLANKFPNITKIFTKYANKYYKIFIPNIHELTAQLQWIGTQRPPKKKKKTKRCETHHQLLYSSCNFWLSVISLAMQSSL